MIKKVFFVLGIVLLLCIVAGLCLYAIPHNTKINTTLQTTKLDMNGNIIGAEEIALQGSFKNYLFKEDALELYITPFGNLKSIILANDNNGNISIVPIAFDNFYSFSFMAWDISRGDSTFGSITTSQDFEYWVFRVKENGEPVYYVASLTEHTVEEIVQYFKGIAPGYKAL